MEEQVPAAASGTPRLWFARIAAVVFVIVVITTAFVLGRLGRNDAQRRAAELERVNAVLQEQQQRRLQRAAPRPSQ